MKEKTIIIICFLSGIFMILDPIIGILAFYEGLSNIFLIYIYLSIFMGIFVIIGAIFAISDYTPLGLDYLKISLNILRISIIIGFAGIIIFNILVIIQYIQKPADISLIYIIIYNIIEVISIIIIITIQFKLKNALETHDHGKDFSH